GCCLAATTMPPTFTPKYTPRPPPQPLLRVARMAAVRRQRPAQVGHRFEVVDRTEFVDVRQHRLDALGLGLEALEAQQRVEPDQPPAGAVQPVDLEGEAVVG